MATLYKIELTSHWLNYHPKDIEKIIEKAMYSEDMNEVTVKAERKQFSIPVVVGQSEQLPLNKTFFNKARSLSYTEFSKWINTILR